MKRGGIIFYTFRTHLTKELIKAVATYRKWFGILAIFLLFCSMSGCNLFYEDVELHGVKSAHVKRVTSKSVELDLMVHMTNPNNFDITIIDSDLEAYADTLKIGNAKINKEIVIPANSSADYHTPVLATFDEHFANNLGSFVRIALSGPIEIDVKGEIKGKALFLTKTIEIDIREKFEF